MSIRKGQDTTLRTDFRKDLFDSGADEFIIGDIFSNIYEKIVCPFELGVLVQAECFAAAAFDEIACHGSLEVLFGHRNDIARVIAPLGIGFVVESEIDLERVAENHLAFLKEQRNGFFRVNPLVFSESEHSSVGQSYFAI